MFTGITTNGLPISFATEYTGITTTALCGIGNIPPSPISTEKGIRNFTDAASHNPYRTRPRFFRSASVVPHTKQANAVDCQR